MSFISTQSKGTLLVALSGILYGIVGYCGTMLFQEHFSVPAMLFWRFVIASIWMGATCYLQRKRLSIPVKHPGNLLKAVIFSAIFYSGASAFYFLASEHIGTGAAMVIYFSFPVFVILFSWLLSEWKMNKAAFLSLTGVVAGLILLKGNGETTLNFVGILLGLISALFYGCYVFNGQHTTHVTDTRLLTLLICIGNAIIFLALTCYTHTWILPTTTKAWVNILAIGIISTALPIQLLLDGLKFISSVKASILSVFEPVVVVILGVALLDEAISGVQLIGMIVILTGAILIQFERSADISPAHKADEIIK